MTEALSEMIYENISSSLMSHRDIRGMVFASLYLAYCAKLAGVGVGQLPTLYRNSLSLYTHDKLCKERSEDEWEELYTENAQDLYMDADVLNDVAFHIINDTVVKRGGVMSDLVAGSNYAVFDEEKERAFLSSEGITGELQDELIETFQYQDVIISDVFSDFVDAGFDTLLTKEAVFRLMEAVYSTASCSIARGFAGMCKVGIVVLPIRKDCLSKAEAFCQKLAEDGQDTLFLYRDASSSLIIPNGEDYSWCTISTYGDTDHEVLDYRHLNVEYIKAVKNFCDEVR